MMAIDTSYSGSHVRCSSSKSFTREEIQKIFEETAIPLAQTADEGLSVGQYTLLAFQDDSYKSLSFAGNVLGVGLGGWEFAAAYQARGHANEISDKESFQRSEARMVSGALVASGASFGLAGKAFGAATAVGCNISSDLLFGISALFSAVMSGFGIYRCKGFLNDLNRDKDPLRFLIRKATVTKTEQKKFKKSLDPELSPEERKAALQRLVLQRGEAKMRYFNRRASSKAFELLCNRVNRLGVEGSEAKALEETKELIEHVQGEARKKIALFSVALVAAAVALVALCLGTFCSLGATPFILYAVASSIYLGLGAYSLLGKKTAPPAFLYQSQLS